jgi:hypothetical protein
MTWPYDWLTIDGLVSLKLALTLVVRSVVTFADENRLVVKETWLGPLPSVVDSRRMKDMCLSSTRLDQAGHIVGVTGG